MLGARALDRSICTNFSSAATAEGGVDCFLRHKTVDSARKWGLKTPTLALYSFRCHSDAYRMNDLAPYVVVRYLTC